MNRGHDIEGFRARFVQNRTLTGVGRAGEPLKLHHEAYTLASPDFKQALEAPTAALPQARRLRELRDFQPDMGRVRPRCDPLGLRLSPRMGRITADRARFRRPSARAHLPRV